jgi:hypothetical protein
LRELLSRSVTQSQASRPSGAVFSTPYPGENDGRSAGGGCKLYLNVLI